jgi:hypothetical protein
VVPRPPAVRGVVLTVTRVLHEPAALAWHGLLYQLESLRGAFGLSDPPFRWPPAASAFVPLVPAAASRAGRMHRVVITSAGGAIESSAVVVR